MRSVQKLAQRMLSITRYSTIVLLAFFVSSLAVYTYTRVSGGSTVYAATSSNLNFQGRILNSGGNVVPDGYYNIEFKLYDGGTSGGGVGTGQANAGSLLWTESWYDNNGATAGNDNRVRVINGYFTVNLGSQTAFPNTVKWDQELWLTMNVGGAAQTATPTWDGEMLAPGNARTKLTATPYAFSASQARKIIDEQLNGTGTLDFNTLTANRSIKLPDQDGTLCIQKSADCVDVTTTNTTANTSSNSGLEISSDGLRLLGGCADGEILKWDSTLKTWGCSTDNGSPFNIRESDGTPSNTGVGTLEFGPGTNSSDEFVVTDEGGGVTRVRLGTTVLTTNNYTTTLDTAYVNTAESPAAGDITGSFSAGLTIGANSVALGTDTTGNYVDSLGTLTGLSVTGNTGEGSTPALSVLYGSTSNTAVQGNTQVTCASGSGNLTGGGTVITLGSGGTCAAITTNNAVTFSTSVTTPVLTNSGNMSLNAVSASDTTVSIGNSGAGITNLDLTDGGLYVAGTSILTSGKALNNLTGITSSGTVTLSSLTAGGIVKAGSGGGLSLASAGSDYEVPLTFSNGLTRSSNSVKLGGNLTGATTIGLNSNNLSITGTGTSAINAASGGGLEILADTSAALAVRNSAGTVTYFNVSASGNIVQIGSSSANSNAILFALNSYNGASDPGGAVNGASYYSTTQNADRCYENSYWSDCMTTRSQADSTLGSAAASISLTLASSSETALICNLQVTGRSTNNTIWLRLNNASAAGSYAYNVMQNLTGANNNTTQQSSASATQIPLNGNSSSTNPGSYTININNFSTINKSIDWTGTGSDPTNTIPNLFKGSATYYNTTSSITSVQFLASTGNLNAGTRAWCQAR